MSNVIERPRFYEGQILGADDLQRLLDYARDQDARHARVLHTWGIAQGLKVTPVEGDLQVSAGLAVDSSGAAIVVPAARKVHRDELTQQLGNQADGSYALFVVGRREQAAPDEPLGRSSAGQASRIREQADFRFALSSHTLDWDSQPAPGPGEGPDDDRDSSDRRVLLGFAKWEGGKFTGFETEAEIGQGQDSTSVGVRYAGLRAAEVEAIGGRITLRSAPAGHPDARVLVLDPESDEEAMAFGLDDGTGAIKREPLLRISTGGDVKVTGTVTSSPVKVAKVLVQSGSITDGVRIPLPGGVSETEVQGQDVAIHVMVTPRPDKSAPPTGGPYFAVADECFVEPPYKENRRVRCKFRWCTIATPANSVVRAGVCDYIILVTVPPPTESSP